MATVTAYPFYRDSGLPWLPAIPDGWQVLRNGRLFAHRVQTGFPGLPILEVSLRTGVRVRDMENLKRKQVMAQKEKYKRAAKGDIAYNMMRMWQGALGPAPVDGLVSPAYVVASPFPETNSDYYSYMFRTAGYMVSLQPHHLATFLQQCFNSLRCERQQFIDSAVRPGGEFFEGAG